MRELLEAHSLAADSMDLSQIEEIRADMERYQALRLQPHHVQAFFLEAFKHLGGTISEREPGRYRISHVPAVIRDRAKAVGTAVPVLREYERVTFDKALINPPGQPLAQFLCPGHPLLDTVVDLVLDRYRALLKQRRRPGRRDGSRPGAAHALLPGAAPARRRAAGHFPGSPFCGDRRPRRGESAAALPLISTTARWLMMSKQNRR